MHSRGQASTANLLGLASHQLLHIDNTLLEDLLEDLGILKFLCDLGNDAVGEFLLLALLDLAFVTDPAVKNGFGFGGDGGFLFEFKGLGFELGGFLDRLVKRLIVAFTRYGTHLGDLEQLLCDLDDVAQRLDILDSGLDGLDVAFPCRVQDVLVLGDGGGSPLAIGRTSIFKDSVEDAQQAKGHDTFLVDHVQLIADGPDRDTGACGKDGSLAGDGRPGERVEDRLSLLLGFFGGNVAGVAP